MKLKKPSYSFGIISLLISYNVAQAGTMGEVSPYPNGFTLIAGAGLTEFMSSGSFQTAAGDMSHSYSARGFQYGFAGDLALGYGHLLKHNVYLGTELGSTFLGNTRNHTSSSAADSTIVHDVNLNTSAFVSNAISKQTTVYENAVVPYFDLKPGLIISPKTWIFGRVGINYNEIKIKTNAQYNSSGADITSGVPQTFTNSYSAFSTIHKKRTAGLRTGLGMDYLLKDNLAISANYIYSFYNGLKSSTNSNSQQVACDTLEGCPASDSGFSSTGSTKVNDQQVLLEVIYHLT